MSFARFIVLLFILTHIAQAISAVSMNCKMDSSESALNLTSKVHLFDAESSMKNKQSNKHQALENKLAVVMDHSMHTSTRDQHSHELAVKTNANSVNGAVNFNECCDESCDCPLGGCLTVALNSERLLNNGTMTSSDIFLSPRHAMQFFPPSLFKPPVVS